MRYRSPILVHSLLAGALLLATACSQASPDVPPPATPAGRPTPTVAAPSGLNPVALGGLAGATRIDVLAWKSAPDANSQSGYVPRLAITDPATVRQVLSTLDVDLEPLPKAACIPEYQLRFQLAAGVVRTLGYSCNGPSFLRGDQPGWGEHDGRPPAAFDQLMSELLAAPAPKP